MEENYKNDWLPGEADKHKEGMAMIAKGRALKQSACDLRRNRRKEEAERAAARKKLLDMRKEAEKAAVEKERKDARDTKIRSALLEMANVVKLYGVKFDAPTWGESKDAFKLHVDNEVVQIRTVHNGFQWD